MNFYAKKTKKLIFNLFIVKKINFCKRDSYNVLNMIVKKNIKISNDITELTEKQGPKIMSDIFEGPKLAKIFYRN
jgi:hypothetical protein